MDSSAPRMPERRFRAMQMASRDASLSTGKDRVLLIAVEIMIIFLSDVQLLS